MLRIEILDPSEITRAATIFHRDGFVAVREVMTPEQLSRIQTSVKQVIEQELKADPERKGNRGHHRYSFGGQDHRPEWRMLIDLPTVLPILEAIWESPDGGWHPGRDFTCGGTGGDYSLPGAEIQYLHSDGRPVIADPHGHISIRDVPAPQISLNIMMVDFTEENGATRIVPCTQRSRAPIPSLAEEPQWMRECTICAPAGTALFRDVRCWHGGTANNSDHIRPMTTVSYFAPWYRLGMSKSLPRAAFEQMPPRTQELCRYLVQDRILDPKNCSDAA